MAAFFSLKDFRVVEETKTICSWNSWREIKNMKPYDTDFKYKTVQGRLKWIMFFLWEGISSREIGVCSKMCKKIKSSWLVWLSYKGMLNIHVPEAWGIFPFNNRRNTVSLKKKNDTLQLYVLVEYGLMYSCICCIMIKSGRLTCPSPHERFLNVLSTKK